MNAPSKKIEAADDAAMRSALIAFYERDCLPQKAENLRRGAPLDYLDLRAIAALKAALEAIQ
jgi:hypothetical protein